MVSPPSDGVPLPSTMRRYPARGARACTMVPQTCSILSIATGLGMSCVNLPAGMLERCERTLRRAPEFSRRAPTYLSPLPDLELVSYPIRTEFEATLYEPIVCVALRGCKETAFAERTLEVGAGDCLLISHDLPVVSRITEAPYVALLLSVNLDTLRGLYDEIGAALPDKAERRALEVQKA